MAVAPLDAGAYFNDDFGIVVVEGVAFRDPGNQFGVFFIRIEKVERLVEKVITDTRNATRDKGIEGVVVLNLAGAGIALGAVHDQGAVARDIF